MKKISKGLVLSGVFFLTMGILWLGVIYERAKAILPTEKRSIVQPKFPAASYRELTAEMKQTLERPSAIDRYIAETQPPPPSGPDKSYIKLFWIIAIVEVVCCFLYIFSGFALLRLYSSARFLVFLTLYFDIFHKGMVITYMNYFAIPLEPALRGTNIFYSYYFPKSLAAPLGTLSTYLTGLGFFQPQGALFLFIYLVYLFICFYFFTRPQVKEQFAK